MSREFNGSGLDAWTALEARYPENPFLTAVYADARKALGSAPTFIAQGGLICAGFVKRGRLSSVLEIPSLPCEPTREFLDGIVASCKANGISSVELRTFGSPALSVPPCRSESARRSRTEYCLDLRKWNEQSDISNNHARAIKKARRRGVQLRRCGAEGLDEHVALLYESLGRRGVAVGDYPEEARQLVIQGAGELFQAMDNGAVISSIFVLEAQRGVYYHSSGSNDAGRAFGASHFLIASAAESLRQEGHLTFNLGGGTDPGLVRFKRQFGCLEIRSEAVTLDLSSVMRRTLLSVARIARHLLKAS